MVGNMRSRRSRLWIVALFAVSTSMVVAGCSSSSTPTAATTTLPSTTTTTSATPTPTPTPTPSPLTGGPVLAVKIDHTTASYPRIGLSKADVIYVEPVEGGLTRMLAIFSSHMPDKVGPVRSARESDVDLLANYGKVAFAYSGGSAYTLQKIARGAQVNVSNDASSVGYYRDRSRYAPYNVIGVTATLLKRAGGSVPPKDPGFRFFDAPAGGTAGTKLATSWPANRMSFSWVPASHGYSVVSDGRTEKDALYGNAPVIAKNIVVQYVTMTLSQNRDVRGARTPVETVIGTGKAMFLRDGKVWQGTWSRSSAAAPTTFTTSAGDQMTFAPGQIWVLLVPNGQKASAS